MNKWTHVLARISRHAYHTRPVAHRGACHCKIKSWRYRWTGHASSRLACLLLHWLVTSVQEDGMVWPWTHTDVTHFVMNLQQLKTAKIGYLNPIQKETYSPHCNRSRFKDDTWVVMSAVKHQHLTFHLLLTIGTRNNANAAHYIQRSK